MKHLLPLFCMAALFMASCEKTESPLNNNRLLLRQSSGPSSLYFTYDKTGEKEWLRQLEFRHNGILEQLWKFSVEDETIDFIEVYDHDNRQTGVVDHYYSSTGQLQFIDVFEINDHQKAFLYSYMLKWDGTNFTLGKVADKDGRKYISDYVVYYFDGNETLLEAETFDKDDKLLYHTEYRYETAIKHPLFGLADFDQEYFPVSKYLFTRAVTTDTKGTIKEEQQLTQYELNTAGYPEEMVITSKNGVETRTVFNYE